MIDQTQQTQPQQDQAAPPTGSAPTAFCQNCGKPLTPITARPVGSAIFCEPCLQARLAGVPPFPRANAAPGYPGQPAWTSGTPNPGLAALLGFIPGVGAMYNEQYAKGIVHLIVFAVLVSVANSFNIFGIFVAGWECYMAIEAHHTARARRDGTPLPNPFGLNDIAERMGFGKAWPAGGANVASVFHDLSETLNQASNRANPQPPNPQPHSQPQAHPQAQPQPNASSNDFGGAPWGSSYGSTYGPANGSITPAQQPPPVSPPVTPPFTTPASAPFAGDWSGSASQSARQAYTQPDSQAWRETFGAPPPSATPVSGPTTVPLYTPAPHRFPAGAVWLIGAGVLFLLGTTGLFSRFPADSLVAFGLIALSVWLFFKRMFESGPSLAADGSPAYTYRVLRALRASAWIALVGGLMLLNAFHIMRWSSSWPWFLILAGVLAMLRRAAGHQAATASMPPQGGI